MSVPKIELALEFLHLQPDAAAAILEHETAEEVAALLQEFPQTTGAQLLERMLPQYAARLCNHMSTTRCAAFLGSMNFSIVAAILRFTNSDQRKQILDLLPETTRLACLLTLSYPENTVGAWMISQTASVPGDSTVEQALKNLLEREDQVLIETIYVVDRNRVLLGEISYAALLRSPPDVKMAALPGPKIPVILSRMQLESALTMEIWEHRDTVPVVNRSGEYVGVLRHVDLRRGIAQVANTIAAPVGSDPLTSLLSVYGSSLNSLLDAVGEFTSNKNQ